MGARLAGLVRHPRPRVVLALVALVTLAPAALARSQSTLNQTITDRDGDNRLEPSRGDDHVVREDLGQALEGRERRREELLFFSS